MKKTITLIGINFYPEDTAIGLYSTQMLTFLAEKGYKINVITGFPYYPQWKVLDSYKNKPIFYKEIINNITLYRYKQYVPKNPTFLKRIIHLIDFSFGAFINSFKIKHTDLVIAVVPFTSTVLLGWLLKKRLKAKLWTHIQDFEFDAALQTGVSNNKNRWLTKGLHKIESYLLNRSNLVSTISLSMLNKLKTKTKSNTYYFPNWVSQDHFNSISNKSHPYFKSNKFKILYSGNIGDKQNWLFFIDFLNKMANINNIEVCIVGQGAKKAWLSTKLKNFDFVSFYDPIPLGQLNDLLCSADLHILFQKDDVLDTVMPSKILGMMASGKPSLITGNSQSEVSKIINRSKGGIYLQNNLAEVVNSFILLQSNNNYCKLLGKNARDYILKNYNPNIILPNFELTLKNLLKKPILLS